MVSFESAHLAKIVAVLPRLRLSWRDHRCLGKITPGTETLAGTLAKIPAKIFSCQDPVRIPAGKFRFPARFFISRQDPGRERDSWRDPAGIPVAILQGITV